MSNIFPDGFQNWYEPVIPSVQFSSVQSLSRVWLFVTPWITARQASLSITISRSSVKLTSIKSAMPSSHLILCRPLFLLPPIPPSILYLPQYFGHLMRKTDSFEKTLMLRKIEGGISRQRMRWWDGITDSMDTGLVSRSWWWQGGLVCCSPWGRKESDTTERLNSDTLPSPPIYLHFE